MGTLSLTQATIEIKRRTNREQRSTYCWKKGEVRSDHCSKCFRDGHSTRFHDNYKRDQIASIYTNLLLPPPINLSKSKELEPATKLKNNGKKHQVVLDPCRIRALSNNLAKRTHWPAQVVLTLFRHKDDATSKIIATIKRIISLTWKWYVWIEKPAMFKTILWIHDSSFFIFSSLATL